MYHAELLRCNPSLVGEYSLEQLLDEVKMVWASYLIGMLLDEDSKAEQRAQDAISRQGPDLTKPRVDGMLHLTLLGHTMTTHTLSMGSHYPLNVSTVGCNAQASGMRRLRQRYAWSCQGFCISAFQICQSGDTILEAGHVDHLIQWYRGL